MKRILVLSIVYLILCTPWSWSQNVGIGTTEPGNTLQVTGNFLVNQPYVTTNTAPTMGQTKTMINNSTILYAQSDSTGRFFDPGGPNADYISNLVANANIFTAANSMGIEVTIESIGLGTGDSLILSATAGGQVLLALGNSNNATGKWVFQGFSLYARFKSNGDNNNGIGFSILFRRLYSNVNVLPEVEDFAGNSLFFDVKNGAFRAGLPFNGPMGGYSTAFGVNSKATGNESTAFGENAIASANNSIAMGLSTKASGILSVAMGSTTTASGAYSTAMGTANTATGDYSTAIGSQTIASGYNSTTMGFSTTASGAFSTSTGLYNDVAGDYSTAVGSKMTIYASAPGSFSAGDYEPSNNPIQVTGGAGTNSFTARFRGGYYFLTSQNAPNGDFNQRTGVICAAGQNSWSAWSDVHRKENFLPIDGEYFLRKISSMPQYSWNYKGQSPETFRHYGPMAQDIFSAFGHDALGVIGNDTMINQQDLLGIQFVAIQALEKRTAELQNELTEYKTLVEACLEKIKMLETEKSEGQQTHLAKKDNE